MYAPLGLYMRIHAPYGSRMSLGGSFMPHEAQVRAPPAPLLCVHALGSFKPFEARICYLGAQLCPLGLFFAHLGLKCATPSTARPPMYARPRALLTPKGPRVFWCKTIQNYPLLKKELIILY
jgi:hypothetical protein